MKIRTSKILKKMFVAMMAVIAGFVAIMACNIIVKHSTQDKLFSRVENTPDHKVGLLLGTSKYVKSGQLNLYYKYRIEAAKKLFKTGKIEYILVSGDNGSHQYNEPKTFRNDLISAGIPSDRIVLDYAGFRTLDSIVRAQKVFGQNALTIISQPFHNERAVFIARNKGIEAVGFNAKDVNLRYGIQVQARELLARTMMMLDLYILNRQPKFLGEPIQIG